MSITVIEKTIYLEPKYLDQNIMKHLLDKVKKITFEECTKEYGHILCVKRILKINNLEDTIFTVRFEAETLKPIVGNKLTGTVCMLYKDGIFLQISPTKLILKYPLYLLNNCSKFFKSISDPEDIK